MKERLAKVARIAAVQKQIHRLAEWRLFDLLRREDRLRDEAEELIASLNDHTSLHGLFVGAMAGRLTSIGIETGAVAKARESQAERVLTESRKLRHVERVHDATAVDAGRAAEKAALAEVVEASLRRPAAEPGTRRRSGET